MWRWVSIPAQDQQQQQLSGETMSVAPYRVEAFNTAKQSENKMHDDTVAQRFGFSGGLVPGVEVMAYMMHLPVARWGRDFLERGLVEARFVRPVYDGEIATVTAQESGGVLALQVESRGEICATGSASLPDAPPSVRLADYVATAPLSPRRPVDADSFRLGQRLGTAPRAWAGAAFDDYLAEIRESDPVYRDENLLHPGVFQRIMNKVLVDNAILGPWIHVGSRMQLLAAARPEDELSARATVTANYEKKGHRFVELDAVIIAGADAIVAHCHHIAIYQPREQAAA
jgi:acyl dehydratase